MHKSVVPTLWYLTLWLVSTLPLIHAEQSVEIGDLQPFALEVLVGDSREVEIQAANPASSFILVHFAQFALPEGDSVQVVSKDTKVSYTYTKLGRGNLGDQGGFFTSLIPGNTVRVVYKSIKTTSAVSGHVAFKIDQYSQELDAMHTESICGEDESKPAICYNTNDSPVPQAYAKSKAVARLLINGTRSCTGWLVGSEGHLMTNAHCILNDKEALVTDYEFGAESNTCEDQCMIKGGCRGSTVAQSGVLVARDSSKDYALVKLDFPTEQLAPYGFLTLRGSGPVAGEQIYIPQHPEGFAKRISINANGHGVATINAVNDAKACGPVSYTADTQPGSSGSPVIAAKDNDVVALHRCGSIDGVCTNGASDIREVIISLVQLNKLPSGAVNGPLPTAPSTPPPTSPGANCYKFTDKLICDMITDCVWNGNKCVAKPTSKL